MGTRIYVLKKVVHAALTLAFVLVFNFVLFRVMPSDPVKILTRTSGLELTAEQQRELLRDYGLDKPLFPGQFLDYVGDVLRGDLGVSFVFPGEPVMDVFLRNLWPTVLLVGISTVLSTVIGVLMGIRSGWRRGSAFDLGSMGISLVLYSMPEFWLGMMLLILFATTLGWFPTGGRISTASGLSGLEHLADVANHLVLPVLTLTLAYLGEYYLVMRSSLLDVLGEDYIRTAVAKGLGLRRVLGRHALRNALIPPVTFAGLEFGRMLGGVIAVETIFAWPGAGKALVDAIAGRDFPMIQGLVLAFALLFALVNLLVDLVNGLIDPRVRYP